MKTKAVRLYGKNDLRLEEFELPPINDGEILAHIITDSICMSSYKAAIQGSEHKRVPADVAEKPIIIGHEFCGEIVEVGAKWKNRFKPGDRFSIQPALGLKDDPYSAPGYSFQYVGGAATYVIIPEVSITQGCLLIYKGDSFYHGSLAEPMSCIVGAFHAQYHNEEVGKYIHSMGIKEGGNTALFAAVGPMGLGAIDYALHCDRRPAKLVVTDIDSARLERAARIYTVAEAARCGVELTYINTSNLENAAEHLKGIVGGGFDDVFVFAPVKPVVELADAVLAYDGCLNFFSGPSNTAFSAGMNFYNVHYMSTHIVGTSGGNTDDLIESLDMMAKRSIDPSGMVTHIGGLSAYADTVLNLPKIPGGKKLIYTNTDLPLTAIDDFEKLGETSPLFRGLAEICAKTNGIWSSEAEKFLLSNV